jgi:hypothetical protein
MKLTPEKIQEIYRSTPPYHVDDLMKNYIGQKVCWDLWYSTIIQKKDLILKISLYSFEKKECVLCDISEDVYPFIKIIPPKTPVRLIGVIKKINPYGIEIENAQLHEIKDEDGQIYFPQGSREEILAFLEGNILGAKNIKIYDSYPSDDILKLLESASPGAVIQLLGKDIDMAFSGKIKAFNTYFKKNMVAKKVNVSHARFYIIDDKVLQVDSSFKNNGGNKATTIHRIDKEAAEEVKNDFDKWWNTTIC